MLCAGPTAFAWIQTAARVRGVVVRGRKQYLDRSGKVSGSNETTGETSFSAMIASRRLRKKTGSHIGCPTGLFRPGSRIAILSPVYRRGSRKIPQIRQFPRIRMFGLNGRYTVLARCSRRAHRNAATMHSPAIASPCINISAVI